MNTFEAYVRIACSGVIIKTWVLADNAQDAYCLLQGQYGENNIVHLPTKVG